MPSELSEAINGQADTLMAAGSSTAPGAGAAVTSIAAPPAGVYRVEIEWVLSGTAETALANMKIANGASLLTNMPTITGQRMRMVIPRMTLNGTNTLAVAAIAAATAGAVYSVTIAATRIE